MTRSGGNLYGIVKGQGAKPRPRTAAQKAATRRKLDRAMHDNVIELSAFLPKPLPRAWYDARIGQQKWWGNLARHVEEVLDSPTPPEFHVMMKIAEVWAWFIWDSYADRGIPAPQPNFKEAA